MDMSWMKNPMLQRIDPKKKKIIIDLASTTQGKSVNQALPVLMKANQQLKEQHLSFTKEETELFMQILTRDMSAAEKQKVEMMKQMINTNMKKS